MDIVADFIIAETERLCIREFNIDDADAVFDYAGNAENTVFMEWGPESREEVNNYLISRLKDQITEPRTCFDFAVCLKETNLLIGSMGLFLDEKRTQAELGYIFNRKSWGKGFASEAASEILKFGFMNLDLHRIYAKCDAENLPSENVIKRIGMRKEAETKSSVYTKIRGRWQWRSEKLYAMLQKDFLNRLFESEQN